MICANWKYHLWLICIINASIAVTLIWRVRLKVVYVSHTRTGTIGAFIESIQKASTSWNISTLSTNIKSLSFPFAKGLKILHFDRTNNFYEELSSIISKVFFFRTCRCSSNFQTFNWILMMWRRAHVALSRKYLECL